MSDWIPTREEGLARLEAFLPRAGRTYATDRNFDRGAGNHTGVSTLSPWIRHRLISEQEVVEAVLSRHSFRAAEKFVQEVFWRTYWKGWLELRPSVWSDYRQEVDDALVRMGRDPDLERRYRDATEHGTGIECFDAWATELKATGYMHNHARMWFASIWIFTLELPWALGADFFLRHLLDGDPASNTLSWRWVAGLQTRGKTYLARPSNIEKYTEERFPQAAGLASIAPALEGQPAPAPMAPPVPQHWEWDGVSGLLLTEEDLWPDHILSRIDGPVPAAALIATDLRSPVPVAAPVTSFIEDAATDALGNLDGDAKPFVTASTDEIVNWANSAGIKQLVTGYAPVGPISERLEELERALQAEGIQLVRAMRDWDDASWPHATHGFFKFREKTPKILRTINNRALEPVG